MRVGVRGDRRENVQLTDATPVEAAQRARCARLRKSQLALSAFFATRSVRTGSRAPRGHSTRTSDAGPAGTHLGRAGRSRGASTRALGEHAAATRRRPRSPRRSAACRAPRARVRRSPARRGASPIGGRAGFGTPSAHGRVFRAGPPSRNLSPGVLLSRPQSNAPLPFVPGPTDRSVFSAVRGIITRFLGMVLFCFVVGLSVSGELTGGRRRRAVASPLAG